MSTEKGGFSKGLIIGLLAGGVAGAIAALLYAPKSGKELRSDIKQKASEFAGEATELMKTARSKTAEAVGTSKAHMNEFSSEVKEKADIIIDDAEKVITGIRQKAHAETGRVKNAFRAGMDAYQAEKERDKNSV
jgi:gas vesicle protein